MTGPRGDHPLYTFLVEEAGQQDEHRALVQVAALHRPYRDDLGIWVCERCSWCRPLPKVAVEGWPGTVVHMPVGCYAPCEELRLLAWPLRNRFGFEKEWLPEAGEPTNPPTLPGGLDET